MMNVSVIIPNYNNAPFLEQCISPLASDPAVGEIIVYDNASTDGSIEVIRSLRTDKVRLVEGRENLGATRARHEAVKLARHNVICFVDGDDYVEPMSVSKAAAKLTADRLDISLFRTLRVNAAGTETYPFIEVPPDVIDGRSAFELTVGEWRIHSYGMLRRELYDRTTSEFAFHGYTDDELLARLLFLRASRVGGGEGTYYYRIMPKAHTLDKALGGTQSALRVLELALREGMPTHRLHSLRNATTRGLFRLLREAWRGKVDREKVSRMFAEYDALKIGWNASEWREFAATQAMRPMAALLARRRT